MIDISEYDALIVVDVQNAFADPKGTLYVSGGEMIVGAINQYITIFHKERKTIVFTQDWHPPDHISFNKWPVHCVVDKMGTHMEEGRWGAQFHSRLYTPKHAWMSSIDPIYIKKGYEKPEEVYSGFQGRTRYYTGVKIQRGRKLQQILREKGIIKVLIVGLATDYCVKATAIDSVLYGFDTTVLLDCCRAVNIDKKDEAIAIGEMVLAGVKII